MWLITGVGERVKERGVSSGPVVATWEARGRRGATRVLANPRGSPPETEVYRRSSNTEKWRPAARRPSRPPAHSPPAPRATHPYMHCFVSTPPKNLHVASTEVPSDLGAGCYPQSLETLCWQHRESYVRC